ncbi:hypothetical protein [Burkholderia lata]
MDKPMPLWKIWLIAAIVALVWAACSNDNAPAADIVAARTA